MDYNKMLLDASWKGEFNNVKLAIKNGADVNIKKKNGFTPLMYATQENHKEIVEHLLYKGASINVQDNLGYTALIWASINNCKEVVKYLVDKGADTTIQDKKGYTAFMYANREGYFDIAELVRPKSNLEKILENLSKELLALEKRVDRLEV